MVLCTGAEYSGGVFRNDPNAHNKRLAISTAKSVLVLGGGATGVEAAGYLAEKQTPNGVKIGLLHNNDILLPRIKGAHAKIHPYLLKLGV